VARDAGRGVGDRGHGGDGAAGFVLGRAEIVQPVAGRLYRQDAEVRADCAVGRSGRNGAAAAAELRALKRREPGLRRDR
jgi:hypothetical protein